MGNHNSSLLSIELDHDEGDSEKTPLPAGSLLRGKIVVEVTHPLRCKGGAEEQSCLQLRLYGKEKVCMDRSKSVKTDGSNVKERARKHAERPFLDVRLQWNQFPQVQQLQENVFLVPPGIYAFPFQMQLPLQLPSSTYHPVKRDGSRAAHGCRVQYKLQAQIKTKKGTTATTADATTGSSSWTLPKLHSSPSKTITTIKYIWVAAAASKNQRREPMPCFIEPVCHTVAGVLQTGHLLFGAAVDDCAVPKGGEVRLHLACRNDSPTSLSSVKIQVLEKISWGTTAINHVDSKTGACTTSATLQQTEYLPVATVKNVNLPGVEKEAKSMFKSAMDSFMGVENSPMLLREIHRDLMTGRNVVTIPVPKEVRESFTGQLVQVQHLVRVDFVTAGFAKNPHLEIPLHVLSTTPPAGLPPSFQKGAGKPYCIKAPEVIAAPQETSGPVMATTGVQRPAQQKQPLLAPPVPASAERREELDTPSPATIAATTGFAATTGLADTTPSKQQLYADPKKSSNNEASSLAIPSTASRFSNPFSSLFSKPVNNAPPQKQQEPQEESRDELNQDTRPNPLAPAQPEPGFEPFDHHPVAIASAPLLAPSAPPMMVGGDAVLRRRRGKKKVPVPLAPPKAPCVSLASLRDEMRSAINCYDVVSEKLLQPGWPALFGRLTPDEFGELIAYVDISVDQPRVAVLLAPHLNKAKGGMDSAYVAAALHYADSQHKANMTQRLLPLCKRSNHDLVRAELNEWEQTVAYSAFEEANGRGHRMMRATAS